MKILIAEDSIDKLHALIDFFVERFQQEIQLTERVSLRSALKEIILNTDFDLIILDMSLPNFDVNADEPGGGTPESFAGKELMAQMKLRNLNIPVIVVTQYSQFEGGRITLEQLMSEFSLLYSDFYKGTVYYNSATDLWKAQLYHLISGVGK
ncbi:response regulator [Geomonas subterranea]|uniref:Response regulator n=1 Tax=Geomonas subterranea TaxID=2847989 RepID=A0ABX8LQW2_9BACT|nr:response regulator [Geomonas subterranea]QXE92633.1 response regulator [Geomonas subterranea]QXM09268.1 response regulator [Geomonas subterranea]